MTAAWSNAVDGLPAAHARLRRVVILNRDALDVIRQQDGPETLFYLDPPYLHETRATTGEYAHEMSEQDHVLLLALLSTDGVAGFSEPIDYTTPFGSKVYEALEYELQGKFLLSGYNSRLYDESAKINGWNRHDFTLPNNSASGKTKRKMVECVWCNY